MATTKKTVDPLLEELPPGFPLQPLSADLLEFTVEISPYIIGGATRWRWEIVEHNYKGYVGDHTGQREGQFHSAEECEAGVKEHIARIRQTVQQKLDAPNSYRITL